MWVGLVNELESLRAKFEVSRRKKTELSSSDPVSNWPIYKYTHTHTHTHTQCVHAQSLSHVWFWDFKDCSPQAFLWISQARILEGVAVSFSRGSSWPRDQTQVSCTAGGSFITEQPGKALSPTTQPRVKQTYWFCFSEEPWLVFIPYSLFHSCSFLSGLYTELRGAMNRKAYSGWIMTVLRTALNTWEDSWRKPEHRFSP